MKVIRIPLDRIDSVIRGEHKHYHHSPRYFSIDRKVRDQNGNVQRLEAGDELLFFGKDPDDDRQLEIHPCGEDLLTGDVCQVLVADEGVTARRFHSLQFFEHQMSQV